MKMNKIFLILVLGLIGCNSGSKSNEKNSSRLLGQVDNVKTKNCQKCNFGAVNFANENWNHLSREQLEQFICSFDSSCEYPTELMETRKNQNFGIAWDLLFILFDKYFDDFIETFEENNSISRDYLIQLFSLPAVYDLPHRQILNKLQELDGLTTLQLELLNAFKQSVTAGDKLLIEQK